MKHKHYDMIVAKAANMDLVVFIGLAGSWVQDEMQNSTSCAFSEGADYFLCLPQHKEACLHWLNGGDVIVKDFPDEKYNERTLLAEGFSGWHEATVFMDLPTEIRIKPKKEKRMIVVNGDHVEFASTERIYPESAQIIEIEVEV